MKNLIEATRQTAFLRIFGLLKVPMIWYVRPKVVELSDDCAIVMIPLSRRTKNHFRSMYFGALAVGADCAAGLLAMHHIQKSSKPISLIFKDFEAKFLKRPEGSVDFICQEGGRISEAIEECLRTGERVNIPVKLRAFLHSNSKRDLNECLADFTLTLSLKLKKKSV